MSVKTTSEIINEAKSEIILTAIESIKNIESDDRSFKTIWELYEAQLQESIIILLKKKLPQAKITIATNKNDYPDILIEVPEGQFAVDIKTNVSDSNPAFDMGRMDSYEKDRFNTFKEEWELVIKFDRKNSTLKEVYFIAFHEVVGKRKDGGVKYRKYDGQLRPKNWKHFEKDKTHWKSRQEFLEALNNTKKSWEGINLKGLLEKLTNEERHNLYELLKIEFEENKNNK